MDPSTDGFRGGRQRGRRARGIGGCLDAVATASRAVRFAVRGLAARPGLAMAAIASLALGSGGTAAIFSVVDGLFLRSPDGVVDAAALRRVYIQRDAGVFQATGAAPGSWADFDAMRRAKAFATIGAYLKGAPIDIGRGAEASQSIGSVVSHEMFAVLGIRPALGRLFVPEDDGPRSARPVVVISHAFWRARFGTASDVVGRSLMVNGTTLEIVGVTQEGFIGIDAEPVDVWLPSNMAAPLGIMTDGRRDGRDWRANQRMLAVNYVARIAVHEPVATATSRASTALAQAAALEPRLDPTPDVRVASMALMSLGQTRTSRVLLWLSLAATLVLLIACANVANLLFARSITRRRELAIRLALGASRWRVTAEHLVESLVLAIAGGVAGVLVAYWAVGLMRYFPLPPTAGRIDGRLLAFMLAVSVLAAILSGLLPALRAASIDAVQALRDARAISTAKYYRIRRLLVVVQISLTLCLLIGAILFVRSLQRVYAIDGGVELDRVLAVTIDARRAFPAREMREQFYAFAVARLSELPGVERAALAHFQPFSGLGMGVVWQAAGRAAPRDVEGPYLNPVGPGYFTTVGTSLLQGRDIAASDREGTEPVAVVNEAMAGLLADGRQALGLCVALGPQIKAGGCTRIVGIVETQRHRYLEAKAVPWVFAARAQAPDAVPYGTPVLLVRTRTHGVEYRAAIRNVLQGFGGELPFVQVEPLAETLRDQILPFRLGASLFSVFSLLAVGLSGLGLYGVLGYFVAERTSEIGVRRSLGASAGVIVSLVVRQGLAPIVGGTAIGTAVALAGSRYLAALFYEVKPHDPLSFALASTVLVVIALASTVLPAWRAARLDPAVALRRD
jgi:predicted permease